MKVRYEDRQKRKLLAITDDTLVVGVDIAKNTQQPPAKAGGLRGLKSLFRN